MRHPHGLRAAAGVGVKLIQHSAVIDAVFNGATGTGTYSGNTSTASQASYRHGGFIDSCFFEWDVGPGNWNSSAGFVGILDSVHWNANPSFSGSSGERAMHYLGNAFAYGDSTGTTVSNAANETFLANDVAGFVYNNSNGKIQVYKNGVAGSIYTNTGFIGITKYPCVSYWVGPVTLQSTMRTTPSAYATSYVLPV
jgi:hypothetical protein